MLKWDGQVVGAIGVSGGWAEQRIKPSQMQEHKSSRGRSVVLNYRTRSIKHVNQSSRREVVDEHSGRGVASR